MSETKRLLVVGGTGFVGSHLTRFAIGRGYETYVLSKSRATFMIPFDSASMRLIHVDLYDRAQVKKVMADHSFTHVINGSGYVDHTPFFRGGRQIIDQHFGGIVNMIEALDRSALQGFVHLGSSDEYGNAPAPQREDMRERPISPYSTAKVAAAHFVQMLARTEGFPGSIVRVFLSYGPGQALNRFFPQIIQGCLAGNSFPVSPGEQVRDFCFIDDVCEGIFAALETPASHGEIFNIASGEPVAIRSMIEMVRNLVGKGVPEFGKIAYRPGENMRLFADVQLAKKILGWSVRTSLEEGLRKTIQYYREVQA